MKVAKEREVMKEEDTRAVAGGREEGEEIGERRETLTERRGEKDMIEPTRGKGEGHMTGVRGEKGTTGVTKEREERKI